MPRKLKTFTTSAGFFDLAVAAPSMKAALEAWGSKNNLFHQGVAKVSDDPVVIKATMAKPGVVLRRPVGTSAPFMDPPISKEALLRQAEDLRGQARRARRLAQTLADERDRTRLLDFSKELDEKADDLERKAAAPKGAP
jgi:hypothetical protein